MLSPTNPLGIKAGGEGGTTPALAVVINAIVDALKALRHPRHHHAGDAVHRLAGHPGSQGATPVMTFSHPIDDRYFEDYVEGDVHSFGSIAVEADEIIEFAKRFDPQDLSHRPRGRQADAVSAASSPAAGTPSG